MLTEKSLKIGISLGARIPLKDWRLTLGTKNQLGIAKEVTGKAKKKSLDGYKLTISLPDFVVFESDIDDTTHRFTSYQFCHSTQSLFKALPYSSSVTEDFQVV